MPDLVKIQVPRSFEKEVNNAADWMFLPSTSLGAGNAAKYLGIPYYALLRNVDRFGLTVLYKNRRGKTGRIDKYFLISELKALKAKLESASGEDALRSAEVEDGYFRKNHRKKTKIRRPRKSRLR